MLFSNNQGNAKRGGSRVVGKWRVRAVVAIARWHPCNASGNVATCWADSKTSTPWTAICRASDALGLQWGLTNHNWCNPIFFITRATDPTFKAPAGSTKIIRIFANVIPCLRTDNLLSYHLCSYSRINIALFETNRAAYPPLPVPVSDPRLLQEVGDLAGIDCTSSTIK